MVSHCWWHQTEHDTAVSWSDRACSSLQLCPCFIARYLSLLSYAADTVRSASLRWQACLPRFLYRAAKAVDFCLYAGAIGLCAFWGPVVGAKIVSYRTAVCCEVVCQFVGSIVFGPYSITPYVGVLKSGSLVNAPPELVVYALFCVTTVLPAWHLVSWWQRIPMSPFTSLGR